MPIRPSHHIQTLPVKIEIGLAQICADGIMFSVRITTPSLICGCLWQFVNSYGLNYWRESVVGST